MNTKNIKIVILGALWTIAGGSLAYAFLKDDAKSLEETNLHLQKVARNFYQIYFSDELTLYADNPYIDLRVKDKYLVFSKKEAENNFDYRTLFKEDLKRQVIHKDSVIQYLELNNKNLPHQTQLLQSTWQKLFLYRMYKTETPNFVCMPYETPLYLIQVNDSTLGVNVKQHTSQIQVAFENLSVKLKNQTLAEVSVHVPKQMFSDYYTKERPLKMQVDYLIEEDTISVHKGYIFDPEKEKKHYEFEEVDLK